MKLPIAILKSPLNVIFSFLAALALICGLTSVASASPGTGEKVDNFTPAFPGKFNPHEFLKINDSLGYGWCIDFGLHSPEDKPDLFKEGEVEPKRLTHVAKLPEKASETNYAPEVPFEGRRRDAAINILKKLIEAHQNEDETSSRALNRALQLLLTSTMNKVQSGFFDLVEGDPEAREELQSQIDLVLKYLDEYAGYEHYEITNDNGSRTGLFSFREKSGVSIPKADDDEFITVVTPKGYDVTKGVKNQAQRIVPMDQPGLKKEEKPKPEPRKPVVKTQAAFGEGDTQVVAGATVNDTVEYEDLVPGKQYTLEAQLVDKADASKVLGSGSKDFTADESGNGS
ncbi:VaFE repeat-containing surface-anchored protein, partial [Corynebacterium mastitidis]